MPVAPCSDHEKASQTKYKADRMLIILQRFRQSSAHATGSIWFQCSVAVAQTYAELLGSVSGHIGPSSLAPLSWKSVIPKILESTSNVSSWSVGSRAPHLPSHTFIPGRSHCHGWIKMPWSNGVSGPFAVA